MALKRDNYTCQCCGAKQSRAKGKEVYVEVDHIDGVCNWDALFTEVRKHLLCDPGKMRVLCRDCHRDKADGPQR